jgi:hypothetical protein
MDKKAYSFVMMNILREIPITPSPPMGERV